MDSKRTGLILGSLLLILLISLATSSVSAFEEDSSSEMAINEADIDAISVSGVDGSDINYDVVSAGDADALEKGLVDETTLDADADGEFLNEGPTSHRITESTYSTYFNNGTLINSKFNIGDIIDLSGTFKNKDFKINMPLTITSSAKDAKLINCTVQILEGASGSTISNLFINNSGITEKNIIYLYAVENITVCDNTVFSEGFRSYPVRLFNVSNSNISNNYLESIKGDQMASPSNIVTTLAYYNLISNNTIICDDNNGIYLYSTGGQTGGAYNIISNNDISSSRPIPSSFCYAIQLQGYGNTIANNTVHNMYRGISCMGANDVIDNVIYNIHGSYNSYTGDNGVDEGGEGAIVASANCNVIGNKISDCFLNNSMASISISGSNVLVENNSIVNCTGFGMKYGDTDVENLNIINNTIESQNGGIYVSASINNVLIKDNTINTTNGVGISLAKRSSSKYPSNVTIKDNVIMANKTAIDATGVLDGKVFLTNNEVYGKEIKLPANMVDYKIYEITEDTLYDYFDYAGNLQSFINDKDILEFSGDFTSKGKLTISSKVSIYGKDAVFQDTTFTILESDVIIQDLVINNTDKNIEHNWGIQVKEANNVSIINNWIYVVDRACAYPIYLLNANNCTLSSNTLFATGDFLTVPIMIYSSDNNTISNNTISALGTGNAYTNYDESCVDGCIDGCLDGCLDGYMDGCLDGSYGCLDGCTDGCTDGCLDGCIDGFMDGSTDGTHIVQGIFTSYGGFMVYSDNNKFINNTVNVSSALDAVNPYNESTNAIAGIYAHYGSNNNTISNNQVFVGGNDPFVYGIGVIGGNEGDYLAYGAASNTIDNNKIILEGPYAAKGINLGFNATDTIISNNDIEISANNYSYGITVYKASDNAIYQNNITASSDDFAYGITTYHSPDTWTNENNIIAQYEIVDFKDTSIEFNDTYAIPVNREKSIIVPIVAEDDSTVDVGFVKIYLDGVELATETVSDGKVNIALFKDIIGDFNLTMKYVGDVQYLSSYASTTISTYDPTSNVTHTGNDVRDIQDAIDKANDGDFVYLGEGYSYSNLENINITKNIIICAGANVNLTPAESSSSIFNIISKSENGPNNVSFVNLTIIAKNNTILASAVAEDNGVLSEIAEININNVTVEIEEGVNPGTVSLLKLSTDSKIFKPSNSINISGNTIISGVKPLEFISTYWEDGAGALVIPAADKVKTVISVDSVSVRERSIIATLKDVNGNLLSDMPVDLYMQANGEKVIGLAHLTKNTDENGQVIIDNLSGSHLISLLFAGDDKYEASETLVNYTGPIFIEKKASFIRCDNLTTNCVVIERTGKYFTAKLEDSDGNAVVGRAVVIGFNGKTYNRTTNESGEFRLQVNLANAGGYTFAISFLGDDEYNASFAVAKIIVVKNNASLTITPTSISKSKATNVKLNFKLANGTAVGGKTVYLKVNGKTYSAKTNSNGVATVKVTISVKGSYTYSAWYNGDNQINKVTKTGKISVK